MADTFTAVDLSRLPPPAVIRSLDFDTVYADLLASFRALLPGFDASVDSDPVVKILQLAAYRELLVRQQINDDARAVMVAFATGADLDHLAAAFGVARLTVAPADPQAGTPAILESDDDLRRRMTLAPEGYSVAGPEGAYTFHALSADGDVLDASATSPAPGQVLVTVLSRSGDGTASPALLARVAAHLSDETRRPLTDHVTVRAAQIVHYAVEAEITTFAGPDAAIVLDAARDALDALVERSHRLGIDVTRARIFAALAPEGVQNVRLIQPAADLVVDRTGAGHCTAIVLRHAGTGE